MLKTEKFDLIFFLLITNKAKFSEIILHQLLDLFLFQKLMMDLSMYLLLKTGNFKCSNRSILSPPYITLLFLIFSLIANFFTDCIRSVSKTKSRFSSITIFIASSISIFISDGEKFLHLSAIIS